MNLVTKKNDPNYAQVIGHIPLEMARQFSILCAAKQITKSEALEDAITLLLTKYKDLLPNPNVQLARGEGNSEDDHP